MADFLKIRTYCRKQPDDSRHFPTKVFRLLHKENLLQVNLPLDYQTTELQNPLYKSLFEIGKCDLSVGRIFEGHINALDLIKLYGSSSQKDFYFKEAQKGKLFSVWNTEMNSEAVNATIKKEIINLNGAKTFCSGALHIDYAIITAAIKDKKQMLIIPLKDFPQLEEDWSLWQPMGMKNSVSCRIDFSGLKVSAKYILGEPNEYEKQPIFSGGAMRFAAVQLGGAKAVMNATLEHLQKLNRTGDPYQQQRVAKMAIGMNSGKFWVKEAQRIEDNIINLSSEEIVNFANMMRSVVLEISEDILQLAERSVGVQGFMEGHPLEKAYRDLKVYLKQPGPDLALQNVGSFTLNHYKQ